MNHTDKATQWKYAHDNINNTDIQGFIQGLILDEEGVTLAEIRTTPERLKLIVRAVNCHDELVEALIAVEDCLGHLYESGRIHYPQDDAPYIAGKLEMAQAALAKAEGKG